MTAPAVTTSVRRQLLVDTAVALQDDPLPLWQALRDRQHAHLSHDGIELYALLRAALWADSSHLAAHLAVVAEAVATVERHGLTEGHDDCGCGYECVCVGTGRRCSECEDRPLRFLDDRVDALRWLLGETVSHTAVAEFFEAAA